MISMLTTCFNNLAKTNAGHYKEKQFPSLRTAKGRVF